MMKICNTTKVLLHYTTEKNIKFQKEFTPGKLLPALKIHKTKVMVQNRAETNYSYATVRYMVMLEVMFIFLLVHENHPGNHTMIWKVVYNVQRNVLSLSESQECLFKTTLKNATVCGPSAFQ